MNNLIHKVHIYRTDGKHIETLVSEDIELAETMYKGLEKEWIDSTAENRPFRLPSPRMHSFAPALILEIKVESISKEEHANSSNPYFRQMEQDGLGGSMNRHFNNGGMR